MSKDSIFYILDMDRTLLDTIGNGEFFLEVVHDHDPDVAKQLKVETEESYQRGDTFSMRQFAAKYLDDAQMKQIEEEYLRQIAKKDFLNEGAQELMDALRNNNKPFGIITYGSFDGQALKMKGNKLDRIPHIITDVKHKGDLISSWLQDDGTFAVPKELSKDELIVNEIVLVDDKAQSFVGIPDQVRGYLVHLPNNPLPIGEVPDRIISVTSLYDVITGESLA